MLEENELEVLKLYPPGKLCDEWQSCVNLCDIHARDLHCEDCAAYWELVEMERNDKIFDIESLSINQGDYILLTYNEAQITCDKLQDVFESLNEKFKGRNTVIAIPNSINVTAYSKSEMIMFLKNLLNEIEISEVDDKNEGIR